MFVIGLLAGIAVVLLVMSEIAAIAPTTRPERMRVLVLCCAIPVLVVFGIAWLIDIRALLA